MDEKNKKSEQLINDLNLNLHEIDFKDFNFREQYLDEYHNCLLCGSELIYTHQTDFVYLRVEEQAHCPHCKIKTKKADHRLQ